MRGARWTRAFGITFLSILREYAPGVPHVQTIETLACQQRFLAAW